ncbi:MAG: hypothetical protein MUC59_03440 [Saprospiraceae bacterium]|jgi:hypothetical protein|nr:hypothetical protein [Saprospiraceae bacterium]
MSHRLKIAFYIWVILLFGYAIFTSINSHKEVPARIKLFNQKAFIGQITYFNCSSAGLRVSLNNEVEKHNLFIDNNHTLNMDFCGFVSVGDSLFKVSQDEYIHIFKGGKEHTFKTLKVEEQSPID